MRIKIGESDYILRVIHVRDVFRDRESNPLRGTIIRLALMGIDRLWKNGSKFEACSICKPPDQFSRKKGRKLACVNFMKKWGNYFTKEQRKVIFNAVCPEFNKGK